MSYAKAKQQHEQQTYGDGFGPLPCSFCRIETKRETLAAYGARCFRCYGAYCEAAPKAPEWMADKRVDGPKAWAHSLKLREESGERLLPTQKAMWRSALKYEGAA